MLCYGAAVCAMLWSNCLCYVMEQLCYGATVCAMLWSNCLCYVMEQLSVLCYGATVCAMLWSLLVSIIDDHRWVFDAFNGMHPEVTPVEGVDVDI